MISLEGNLNGNDNLYLEESVEAFEEKVANERIIDPTILMPIVLDPLKPEQVRSIEFGYRGVLAEDIYLDLSTHVNVYKDFLGSTELIEPEGDAQAGDETGVNAILTENYRLIRYTANAKENVLTYGVSFGLTYYMKHGLSMSLNNTFSGLKYVDDGEDPIIPGFNTPKNKLNIGFTGDRVWKGLGFSVNWKWIASYLWESPFGDGQIPKYNIMDAQIRYELPKYITLRFGGNNIFNNRHIEAYGSPLIGGLMYGSIEIDLNKK